MQDTIYAAPAAALADARVDATPTAAPFFVVAPWKFVVMYVATFGLYRLYWSYMHWARFRRATGTPMWPVARSILSIFFVHSLMLEMEHRARRKAPVHWSPTALATIYIVALIASSVLGRLPVEGRAGAVVVLVSIALIAPLAWVMARMQRVANIACDDPSGASNARITGANVVWLVLGGLWWLLALFGVVVMARGIE